MHPPGADTVVARYGEVGTKSRAVRGRMVERLRGNLAALLEDRGLSGRVEHRQARVVVSTTEADVEAATDAACEAFGVESASPARRVDPTLPAIREALAEAADACHDGGSFAVRAQRAGDHGFTSEDIEREGGSAVWEAVAAGGGDPAVDLEAPDRTYGVDCRPEEAYVFVEKQAGPGGLPVGTQEPVVALVSGGIDSPVAAYETMKRGCPVVPLYLDLGEYGGPDHRARAEEVTRKLAALVPETDMRLRVAPAGEAVADLVVSVERGRMLAFRRFMFAVAEAVAEREGCVGVVTGESIGQKSSQTSANLRVTSAAVDLPVHRPLLTENKNDIVERARAIGTFRDSTVPAGCERFVPATPMTGATLAAVEDVEPDWLFERAEAVGSAATAGERAE
jgi:thiamine biosynthesis protein ThiI